MLVARSPIESRPRARAVDPAAVGALFAIPALAALVAVLAARAGSGEVEAHRDGWRPTVQAIEPARVPTVRRAPSTVAPSRPAPTPTRVRAVESPTPAVAVAARPARATSTSEPDAMGFGTLSSEGEWAWDEAGFRAWWSQRRAWYEAYWARRRWARIAPAVARVRAMRASILASLQESGALSFARSDLERMDDCGPFTCSGAGGAASTPSSQPAASRAVARRDGARWTLTNAHASLTIHAAQACRVESRLRASGATSLVFDTPTSPSGDDGPVAGCEVRERAFDGGAALELSWQGEGWTQQAVITLAHDGARPEATLARNTRGADGRRTLELSNLSGAERQWTVAGRALAVEPGGVVRVREPSPGALDEE